MNRFAVISCGCQNAWAVELRSTTSRCTRCGRTTDLAKRQRHWTGDDAKAAARAVGAVRTALAQGLSIDEAGNAANALLLDPRPVRHDSPTDAAAAKAREHTNHGDRAENVALWLTRLQGPTDEATYLDALQKAGLSLERAQKEIIRMLACDIIYEPQAGRYAALTS